MAKKIIIESQSGVDPKHNRLAAEALTEMLEMFPEFKDKFEIEDRKNFKPQGSKIDQADFDLLPDDNHKKLYIKLPNGKYLVPYASTDWYLAQAKKLSNGGFDSEILTKLRADANDADKPITITLTKDGFMPNFTGYGVQNLGASIATGTFDQDNDDFFKNIIKHEMGHVFRATYPGRENIIEQNGQHCTNADCIMDVTCSNLNRYIDKPFCDECVEAMRENLSELLENERSLNVSSRSQSTTNHVDDSWKKPLREFYTRSAQYKNLQYVENTNAANFETQLKKNDGSVTNVDASAIDNISLSAADKDGNREVPGQAHFDDLVKYARKNQMNAIRLGDIQTPEFKARMVLACLSANPPMKMLNCPPLSGGFFNGVDAATKAKIEALLQQQNQNQNQQNQNNNNNPPSGTNPPPTVLTLFGGKPFVISRNKAVTRLEQKEKLGTITPEEQKKLDYARFHIKKEAEFVAASQRAGGGRADPRTAEHIKKSGLPAKDYYFNSQARNGVSAWKLHLDVVPNRNDPTTKAVSEMLEKLDIDHKIFHGGENGKGMTIYVGSYLDSKKLSKEINLRFGKDIAEPPIYTDQRGSESMFNQVVSGRFYLQNCFQTQYPHGSVEGICPATYGCASDEQSECFIFVQALKENILPAGTKTSECFSLSMDWDFEKRYTFNALEAYCAHKLYEKHMGEFYNGTNPDLYEQKMFENIIPAAGTPERATWDKIAVNFEKHIAQEYPQGIAKMRAQAAAYTPIDFSKLPPLQNTPNHNNNGRP